jgi:hypothetical protein
MKHLGILILFLLSALQAGAGNVIDLSGNWQARLHGNPSLHAVKLPGSLLTNNLCDELSVDTRWTGSLYDSSFYYNPYMAPYRRKGHMKFPFFLTPNKHYVGEAVYTRAIFVPKAWKGRKVTLFLERPHIETTVTVNGIVVGHQMSLNTPHVYDVTSAIVPGKENAIVIKVYNGIENVCVGQDSHSVTDQTQGNWNGLVGRMELQCHGRHAVGNVQVYPHINNESATVVVSGTKEKLTFLLDGKSVDAKRQNDSTYLLAVKNARQWSEASPSVYQLVVCSHDDTCRTTFGMREISIRGTQFYLNGHPIWIRGTVENCDFPLTGFPPTDVASWKRIFVKCKQYGLNAMRFHSYCPPEAAFTAADEVGFYLAPEGPSWPNHGVKMNCGMAIDRYLMDETQRMVRCYGNHPSFLMMSAGNEPAGDWVTWGNRWVAYWKQTDPRRVYCSFNVGGGWAWDNGSEYHVKGGGRGLDWNHAAPQSMDNYDKDLHFPRNYKDSVPNHSPIIAHEQGQWCAFPDLRERSQYTGVYKTYNFDIFADLLRDNGMATMAGKFLHASGKLQSLCYRLEMERNLRTKDYAGFMLLGLNDYSGQGTALVGPLSVFWREKGYVDSTEWRQSCNDLVVMAEFPKFVFASGETCDVSVDVYNAVYGKDSLRAQLSYAISPSVGNTIAGTFDISSGKRLHVARIPLFTNAVQPGKYTLTLRLQADGRTVTNQYDYWVYPPLSSLDGEPHDRDLYITDSLDSRALTLLRHGGKVLITAAGKVRYGNDVKQTYLPVFWNTSWFKMRPPHTTGLTIDSQHPLFREFPTDDWSNLNWWELVNNAQVMNLAALPRDYQSPIQPIDTWHVSRKLGMLIEANVLNGKLLMTTMDISNHLDHRLVARQMRKALIDYMESDNFQPILTLPVSVITDLFTKTAPAVNMYTKDSPDELKPKVK